MTLTIQLSPDVEKKLRDGAAERGLAIDAYAQKLIEKALDGGAETSPGLPAGASLDEILAPFRREVEQSGMSDDELRDFFTEAQNEVRTEKRAKRAQEKTGG
jgi:hypothetical protein